MDNEDIHMVRKHSLIAPVTVSIAAVLSLLGCDSRMSIDPPASNTRLLAHLTPDAARHVNHAGYFTSQQPASLVDEALISPVQARKLAMAYLRDFGQFHLPTWEQDRGGKIDLARLSPSGRIHFAQSPYAPLGTQMHAAHRRQYGPYYVLTLNSGSEPVVAVAVSALATDHSVNSKGQLVVPLEWGMAFMHNGIARGESALPSPEEAAILVSQATGALVSAAPELVLPGADYSPTFARWRIELDRPIRARPSGGGPERAVRTVYVTGYRQLRFAVEDGHPGSVGMKDMFPKAEGADQDWVRVPVATMPGRSAAFQAVELKRETN